MRIERRDDDNGDPRGGYTRSFTYCVRYGTSLFQYPKPPLILHFVAQRVLSPHVRRIPNNVYNNDNIPWQSSPLRRRALGARADASDQTPCKSNSVPIRIHDPCCHHGRCKCCRWKVINNDNILKETHILAACFTASRAVISFRLSFSISVLATDFPFPIAHPWYPFFCWEVRKTIAFHEDDTQ